MKKTGLALILAGLGAVSNCAPAVSKPKNPSGVPTQISQSSQTPELSQTLQPSQSPQPTEAYQLARKMLEYTLNETFPKGYESKPRGNHYCSGCVIYTDKETGKEIPVDTIWDKMKQLYAKDPSVDGKNPEDVIPNIVPHTIQIKDVRVKDDDFSFSIESRVYFEGNGPDAKLNLNNPKNRLKIDCFDGRFIRFTSFTDIGIDGILDETTGSYVDKQAYLETLRKIDQIYLRGQTLESLKKFRLSIFN